MAGGITSVLGKLTLSVSVTCESDSVLKGLQQQFDRAQQVENSARTKE